MSDFSIPLEEFNKLTVDGDDYPIDKFNASGARFQIGVTFFPFPQPGQ